MKIGTFESKKHLLFKSTASFFSRIMGAVSGLIVSVSIARTLGTSEAGIYFLCFTFALALSAVGRFGVDNTVLKFIGKATTKSNSGIENVINKTLNVTILASLTTAAILITGNGILADILLPQTDISTALYASVALIVGLSSTTYVSMVLQGLGHSVSSNSVRYIAPNIIFVIIVMLSNLDTAAEALLYYALANLLAAVVGGLLTSIITPRGVSYGVTYQEIIESCSPLWVVTIMTQIIQWGGQLIGSLWLSEVEIGELAVAQRLTMLLAFVLTAVNMVIAPKFAALFEQNDLKAVEKLARNSTAIVMTASAPLLLVIVFAGEFILSLFGPTYTGAKEVLIILSLGQLINIVTGSVSFLLSMSGNEKLLRTSLLVSAPLAIILTAVLTPYFGLIGAAWASSIGLSAQNLIALYFVVRRIKINLAPSFK